MMWLFGCITGMGIGSFVTALCSGGCSRERSTIMGSRDHSCPQCGRGGMNDPGDAEIVRYQEDLCSVNADLIVAISERNEALRVVEAANAWTQFLVHNSPPDVPFPSLLVAQCIAKGEKP